MVTPAKVAVVAMQLRLEDALVRARERMDCASRRRAMARQRQEALDGLTGEVNPLVERLAEWLLATGQLSQAEADAPDEPDPDEQLDEDEPVEGKFVPGKLDEDTAA